MAPSQLFFQYSTSPAFASGIIRRLTRSRWSHIDLIIQGEGLLGVSGQDNALNDPGGVRIRPFNAWTYLYPPIVATVHCDEKVVRTGIEWGRSQIGKPFDHIALHHFLRDRAGLVPARDWRDPTSWFCSDYQVRLTELGGLFKYTLIVTRDVVSPQDTLLLFNPFMTEDNIQEFL